MGNGLILVVSFADHDRTLVIMRTGFGPRVDVSQQ